MDGRKRTRSTAFGQPDDDHQQTSPVLEIVENESYWDDNYYSEEDVDYSTDEEFSRSDLEFLEDDDFYYSPEMDEDDVDPDELSYEELIALGENVGVECKGLPEVEIAKHLHPFTCHSTLDLLIDRCVICQVEYEQGENLVALNCEHPYHSECIGIWLQIKKVCPVCNDEASSTRTSSSSRKM